MALVPAGCRNGQQRMGSPLEAVRDAPGLTHIHGLGINPGDKLLYVAAHSGLYQMRNGRAEIVANRYQDTMGFTVAGPDHFLASGHPDLRENLPPLLGLLESRDAGKTWAKKSLLGQADFHALRYAHGEIWAYDSTSSSLMVSEDGQRWQTRSAIVIRDFVVSPDSSEIVLASNGETLVRSDSSGRRWSEIDSPSRPLLLSWQDKDELWLVTVDGVVHRSADSGGSWDERGKLATQPAAFVVDRGSLYLASHNEVFRSRDGGATWQRILVDEGHTS